MGTLQVGQCCTPSFTYKNTKNAIDFYAKAFGAKTIDTFASMDGKGIMHAVIQIGDSRIMMGDEMTSGGCKSAETLGDCPITQFIYVPNVDAAFKQDQFYLAQAFGGIPLDRALLADLPFVENLLGVLEFIVRRDGFLRDDRDLRRGFDFKLSDERSDLFFIFLLQSSDRYNKSRQF